MSVADIEKDALSAQNSFLFACEQNDLQILSQYLEPTPIKNAQTHYKTGLNVTIIHNNLSALKYLLNKVKTYHLIDLAKDNDLLLEACQHQREEIVYFLLSEQGIKTDFNYQHIQKALEKCCVNGNLKLVQYLSEKDQFDYTHALYLTTFYERQTILDYLIIQFEVDLTQSYLNWLYTSNKENDGVKYAKSLVEKRQLKEKLICLPIHPHQAQRKI